MMMMMMMKTIDEDGDDEDKVCSYSISQYIWYVTLTATLTDVN